MNKWLNKIQINKFKIKFLKKKKKKIYIYIYNKNTLKFKHYKK